jgi:hypothetical protein
VGGGGGGGGRYIGWSAGETSLNTLSSLPIYAMIGGGGGVQVCYAHELGRLAESLQEPPI